MLQASSLAARRIRFLAFRAYGLGLGKGIIGAGMLQIDGLFTLDYYGGNIMSCKYLMAPCPCEHLINPHPNPYTPILLAKAVTPIRKKLNPVQISFSLNPNP